MRRSVRLISFLVVLSAVPTISGCGTDNSPVKTQALHSVYPAQDWAEAAPEDLDMDSSRLGALQHYLESYVPASLVVVRKGYIVWEQYYRGFSRDTAFEIWSATKSFTSALAGIAIAEGLFSADQPAADFIDSWKSPDPRAAVRIRDLLTMTSGLHWSWSEYFHVGMSFPRGALSEDLLAYGLNLPLQWAPGSHWTYNNCALMTMDRIFSNATGTELRDFAKERLFAPIGMNSTTWVTDGHGDTYPFMGIFATARDLARFGYLYLRGGSWEGRQVVPQNWVLLTTKPYDLNLNPAYGYLWWVNGYSDHWQPMDGQINTGLPKKGYFFGDGVPPDSYAAEGALGQMIAVLPELDLVMVRTGGSEDYTEQELFPLICQTVVERDSIP